MRALTGPALRACGGRSSSRAGFVKGGDEHGGKSLVKGGGKGPEPGGKSPHKSWADITELTAANANNDKGIWKGP